MKAIPQRKIEEACTRFINKFIKYDLDLVWDIDVKEGASNDFIIWYRINEHRYVHFIFNRWLVDDYQETEE